LKNLLKLQELDLKIEKLRLRETEIPKQKSRFSIHKKRLDDELKGSETRHKNLLLEQRDCEGEIATKQADIKKKEGQLLAVKKNEEYQALLHEMEMSRKQIAAKEERIIAIMMEMDEAKSCLEEDKKRIGAELAEIESECAKIDEELAVAVAERKALEARRAPLLGSIETGLLRKYERIRQAKKTGPAIVPLQGESCSGCFMSITAQNVNEILAGDKFLPCHHCGRLVYYAPKFQDAAAHVAEGGH
jgi:predicted  nucleic acid-binding Zn-ribbon protein